MSPKRETRPRARGSAAKPAARKPAPKPAASLAGYSGKPLVDKLGVKPGMDVAVIGLDDPRGFMADLGARAGRVTTGRAPKGVAMVVVRMDAARDLARLATLERTIARDGAVWVVWPKGRPALKEDMVRAAALATGLVDVKVCAFSETLSALKLVVPVARR